MPPQSISSLGDLKAALITPEWVEVVQDQATWLPRLVEQTTWQTRLSTHFVLHYVDDTPQTTGALFTNFLDASENIYNELIAFFELQPKTKQEALIERGRLTYFIVHTRSQRTFGGLTDPHLLFYLMDIGADPDVMTRIRHELAHWVWSRRFGEAPRLWQEGVAVYAELSSGTMRDARSNDYLLKPPPADAPRMIDLANNARFWQYDNAYLVAGSWIAYLVKQRGWEPLKALFLRCDYEDTDSPTKFLDIYGVTMDAMEDECREAPR